MGKEKGKPLLIDYKSEINMNIMARCFECKKLIEVTDVICNQPNLLIEVEPHNCTS